MTLQVGQHHQQSFRPFATLRSMMLRRVSLRIWPSASSPRRWWLKWWWSDKAYLKAAFVAFFVMTSLGLIMFHGPSEDGDDTNLVRFYPGPYALDDHDGAVRSWWSGLRTSIFNNACGGGGGRGGGGGGASDEVVNRRWKPMLDAELRFWEEWLKTGGMKWKHAFGELMQARELRDDIKWHLSQESVWSGRPIRILDAGSGPATVLGSVWKGKDLDLRAADVLAHEYDALLRKYMVSPPVRAIKADFTKLSSVYERGFFDMVHIRNALDQAKDPVQVIREAMRVTHVQGVILLRHVRRAALRSGGEIVHGVHLWNFDRIDDSPVLWNCNAFHNLTELFSEEMRMSIHTTTDWIEVKMQKLV